MKRSEVNSIITGLAGFFEKHQFMLPEWASWEPQQWKGKYDACSEIIDNKLGWDITDFGSGDFGKRGLSLFTIRNGNWDKKDKLFCEKIMVADEEQETPMHFHWNKTEDIINRGGGNLVMELHYATADDQLSSEPVTVSIDGVKITIQAGKQLILKPGQSICLKPRMYHRFYGEKGKGRVLIGEVSMVNDDANDNRFFEVIGRFPEIVEDEKPVRLLVNDYSKYL
jgi:D-lyxose ketol-isomerase